MSDVMQRIDVPGLVVFDVVQADRLEASTKAGWTLVAAVQSQKFVDISELMPAEFQPKDSPSYNYGGNSPRTWMQVFLEESNRKLENDIAKLRTAIGDLRMKEILGGKA